VTIRAPGSIGNVGPGLDVLGLAVTGPADLVTLTRSDRAGLSVENPGHPSLPRAPERNTASLAIVAACRLPGLTVHVRKGLPLAGGQGGSAASAAAGAVAANLLLDLALTPLQLVEAALDAETVVAGRHADNVAPSILGGLVLIRSVDPLDIISLPVPPSLRCVLVHPDYALLTSVGRQALPATVSRDDAMAQAANVAGLVAGAFLGDLALLGRALEDRIAEPARGPLLPGFPEARRAALDAGALGCSISGSGPTAFALVTEETAVQVLSAMREAYARRGIASEGRIASTELRGAGPA
jgi:homoserine kinase